MEKIEKLREIVEAAILSKSVTQTALSKETGVDQATISRFYKHGHGLSAENFIRLAKWAGWEIVQANDDPTREVVFVNPRLHEDYKSLPHPIPDDYRAIPLTNMEVAAGPGLNTQEEPELKSWVLIYTQELALRSVRLVAARVGKNQKSMLPSIQPGDIVVIDLDDKDIKRPGIFLIRDPDEGAALKRVKYFVKRGQPSITFYSDNAADGYEPMTYTLDEFDHDQTKAIDKAIVGRCIWQWGDLEHR